MTIPLQAAIQAATHTGHFGVSATINAEVTQAHRPLKDTMGFEAFVIEEFSHVQILSF